MTLVSHRKPKEALITRIKKRLHLVSPAPREVKYVAVVEDLYTRKQHTIEVMVREGYEAQDALSLAKETVRLVERHVKEHAFDLLKYYPSVP